LHLGWHNHAIVVPTEVGQITERLQRILGENESTGGQTLKSTEYLEYILAVVRHRHRLAVWSDVLKLLDDSPVAGINDTAPAVGRFRVEDRHKHLLAVH